MHSSPPPSPPYLSPRAHPRLKFAIPLQVQVGKRTFICNTEDISVGGLGARHAQPPPALTLLRVLFNLPNGSSVHTEGVVRHARADRFGIEFLDLSSGAYAALDDYTRRALGYTRRGNRVAKRLTVTLRNVAAGAQDELAETLVLSRNGGRLVCRAHFQAGEELRLFWPRQNRATQVRVISRRPCGPGELAELAFEFLDGDDFWQMATLS